MSFAHILLWWFEYAWPMGSGTIRKCGLNGGNVALLEEVCYSEGRVIRYHIYVHI